MSTDKKIPISHFREESGKRKRRYLFVTKKLEKEL